MSRFVSKGQTRARLASIAAWGTLTAALLLVSPVGAQDAKPSEAPQSVVAEPKAQAGPAAPEVKSPAKDAVKLPPASAGPEGFFIQSENGDYKLRVSGYVQADSRFYLNDEAGAGTNSFLLRRVRPVFQGTVAKFFEFYVVPDFGEGKVVLYDAYADLRFSSAFRFRFGKSKPPIGLERLQSGSTLTFIERALPTQLVPNRDVGPSILGDLAGGVFSYAVGLVNGGPDGTLSDSDTNDSKDVVGRVVVRPFKKSKSKWINGLGLAVAGSDGKQKGALPAFKSGGQLTFFSYDVKSQADGTRTRFSPQAFWTGGPLGVFAEYVSSKQEVRKGTVSSRIGNAAWQVAGIVMLTGESASVTGVKPKKPFDPSNGTWGALELVARYNTLDVDDAAFDLGLADPTSSATEAKAFALGLNWHLSQRFKYIVNYERTKFAGGAKVGDRPTENALLVRAQISF